MAECSTLAEMGASKSEYSPMVPSLHALLSALSLCTQYCLSMTGCLIPTHSCQPVVVEDQSMPECSTTAEV